ncbi:MAG: DUF3135 domain-containing protein [Burkholderiaceae bacterium]
MYQFDFDEWSTLYQRDPAAFEARRQAVLALELAKAGAKAEPARALLRRLEQQLEGKNDQERIATSMDWMLSSMRQLNGKLRELGATLAQVEAAQTAAAARR